MVSSERAYGQDAKDDTRRKEDFRFATGPLLSRIRQGAVEVRSLGSDDALDEDKVDDAAERGAVNLADEQVARRNLHVERQTLIRGQLDAL